MLETALSRGSEPFRSLHQSIHNADRNRVSPTAIRSTTGRTHASGASPRKHQPSSAGATNVEWSTSTPGPIVEETDTFCMNTPLDDAGFDLLRSETSAAKFS